MSKYLALNGPIGCGKTTLCKVLQGEFMIVNFTDTLKVEAANRLGITLESLIENKHLFREYLQTLAIAIGFNNDPKYLRSALQEWDLQGQPRCLFDNVRSEAQARFLRGLGFEVVRLNIPVELIHSRLELLGMPVPSEEQEMHAIERGLPDHLVDHNIDASKSIELVAESVRRIAYATV